MVPCWQVDAPYDKNKYFFKNILFKSVFLKIAVQSSWNAHENLNIASLPSSIKIVNYKTNLFNQHSKWYPKILKFKLKFGFTSMWLTKLSSLELSPLKTRNIHLYQTFIAWKSSWPQPTLWLVNAGPLSNLLIFDWTEMERAYQPTEVHQLYFQWGSIVFPVFRTMSYIIPQLYTCIQKRIIYPKKTV